jgi:FKBP-type peptidyl-prolyl cis-trans isomerase
LLPFQISDRPGRDLGVIHWHWTMKAGEVAVFTILPELVHGSRGTELMPAYPTLIFEIELLAID